MQCKKCNGRGLTWHNEEHYGPCPECIGGVSSCCDIDTLETPSFDLPLKIGKVHTEKYVITKETMTGYEKTYDEVPINAFIKEISNMILKVFR